MREFELTECVLVRIFFDNEKEYQNFIRFLIDYHIAPIPGLHNDGKNFWISLYNKENANKIKDYLKRNNVVEVIEGNLF